MKKALNAAYAAIATILLIWCILSYGEILCKNLQPDPQYSAYNALILLTSIE